MIVESAAPYRYAVYATPQPGSAWWNAGSRWLGRCLANREFLSQPGLEGVDPADLERLTAEPRRYGWHATLKAPFVLADRCHQDRLLLAVREIARRFEPLSPLHLGVARLGNFLALVPQGDAREVSALASTCVTDLDAYAAPLSHDELERRRRASLTAEEDELLLRWGYPYVHQNFRCHFSLTDTLHGVAPAVQDALRRAAEDWFHELPALHIESLALFVEPRRGADFELLELVGLGE